MKVEDGELVEDANGAKDVKEQDLTVDVETIASDENDNKLLSLQQRGGFRTDAKQRASRTMVRGIIELGPFALIKGLF